MARQPGSVQVMGGRQRAGRLLRASWLPACWSLERGPHSQEPGLSLLLLSHSVHGAELGVPVGRGGRAGLQRQLDAHLHRQKPGGRQQTRGVSQAAGQGRARVGCRRRATLCDEQGAAGRSRQVGTARGPAHTPEGVLHRRPGHSHPLGLHLLQPAAAHQSGIGLGKADSQLQWKAGGKEVEPPASDEGEDQQPGTVAGPMPRGLRGCFKVSVLASPPAHLSGGPALGDEVVDGAGAAVPKVGGQPQPGRGTGAGGIEVDGNLGLGLGAVGQEAYDGRLWQGGKTGQGNTG